MTEIPSSTEEEPKYIEEEKDAEIVESLQKYLENDVAALAIVATYNPKRVSPTKAMYAFLRDQEEVNLEDAVLEIKAQNIKKLFLLVNCRGGTVQSSFICANMIRNNFEYITVFVPHFAVSGGTLLALTGNKIVMGDISHLSPIDIQAERGGNMYSINAMVRSFGALNNLFRNVSEEDAPYPWKAMANKLDPVEFQEWVDASRLMAMHALTILTHKDSSFKDKADDIIETLSTGYPTHEYCIDYEEAKKKLGDNIIKYGDEKLWNIMRKWLRKYINVEASHHIIRFVLPKKEEGELVKKE